MRILFYFLLSLVASWAHGQTNNYNTLDKAFYPTTYGTSGYCWTSNGAGVAPSWKACSGGGGGSSSGTGIQVGDGAGGFVAMPSMNGDCTLNLTSGVITCTNVTGAPTIGTITTGGILYGTGSATIATTGALTGYMKGNGASAPTAAATVPLTDLATQAANTVVMNATAGVAAPTAFVMPSCADTGGNHLNYVNGTGITCGTSSAGSMVYPGAGIGVSTGSAWGTSYSSSNAVPVSVGGTGGTTALTAARGLASSTIIYKSYAAITYATNDTNPYTIASISVPALTANDGVHCSGRVTTTNNANAKTWAFVYNGSSLTSRSTASSNGASFEFRMGNRNATNSQMAWNTWVDSAGNGKLDAVGTSAVDSTSARTLALTVTKATGTDSVTLEGMVCTVITDGT